MGKTDPNSEEDLASCSTGIRRLSRPMKARGTRSQSGYPKRKKVQEEWDSESTLDEDEDSDDGGSVMVEFLGVKRRVDSLEPFCFCHAVKDEIMVACDNPKCLMKWFHLSCVGLLQAPSEQEPYFCPMCAADMKKLQQKEEQEQGGK